MKLIKPSAQIINPPTMLEQVIEIAGRTCYKSEDRITPTSSSAFIQRLRDSKHESVLEHGSITVRFICDRGVSHELVRHRIASFSQESTRYCNYTKDKFNNELTFIQPCWISDELIAANYPAWDEDPEHLQYYVFLNTLRCVEQTYLQLIDAGWSPQEARSILPNSLKTEVVVTANPREWMHIFSLRTGSQAHPQMRELMIPLQREFIQRWPSIFS